VAARIGQNSIAAWVRTAPTWFRKVSGVLHRSRHAAVNADVLSTGPSGLSVVREFRGIRAEPGLESLQTGLRDPCMLCLFNFMHALNVTTIDARREEGVVQNVW
jgi:hypothetical protein